MFSFRTKPGSFPLKGDASSTPPTAGHPWSCARRWPASLPPTHQGRCKWLRRTGRRPNSTAHAGGTAGQAGTLGLTVHRAGLGCRPSLAGRLARPGAAAGQGQMMEQADANSAPRGRPQRRAAARHAGRLDAGSLGPGRRALQALVPATPTPPPVAGAAATPGMPELRGRLLYLGGGQLLVADAGGGPLRPLRMRVAGRTSVLRQGRYLVVRVAEQLQKGPVLAVDDRRARGGHAARQRSGGAALPAARPGLAARPAGPLAAADLHASGGGAGDRQAARHRRVAPRRRAGGDGGRRRTCRDLRAGLPCATWLGGSGSDWART